MLTAARRHAIACAARATGTDAAPDGRAPQRAPTGEYRLQLMQLGEDLRRLKQIQSLERKIAVKADLIRHYDAWIAAALAAPTAAQDEVLTTVMVWAIDIADWPYALRLATHVVQHGLTLPDRYRRTPECLIAEEVATAGLAPEPTVDCATLQAVDDLTTSADMHDEVRAKLQKAIGLAFRARALAFDPTADRAMAGGKPALIAVAMAHLSRALQLDPKCGVKKLIEQLQREAKRTAEASGQ
jgi:hypothetical protein